MWATSMREAMMKTFMKQCKLKKESDWMKVSQLTIMAKSQFNPEMNAMTMTTNRNAL